MALAKIKQANKKHRRELARRQHRDKLRRQIRAKKQNWKQKLAKRESEIEYVNQLRREL